MVEKKLLPNGVRVIYEPLDHVRSCAIGVWVENGSCHEPDELSGMAHFIEHMLFKGTETRTAAQLAQAFDGIGGQVNAFTTKEHTCFYARTLDTHVQTAADLLCDMVLHSVFAQRDLDLERGVVLEEIGMYEDSPEDLVSEILSAACFPGQPLGRPILGYDKTLAAIDHAAMSRYHRTHYVAENTIVALSGSFTEKDLQAVCSLFSAMPSGQRNRLPSACYQKAAVVKKKEIEQNHLLLVFPAVSAADPRRYPLAVLNNILGSGMSSRLFQRVRERSGLCYSIYSYTSLYASAGVLGVYVALGREMQHDALGMIREELLLLREEGVTQDELVRAKEQLKTSLLMGLESTSTRMSALARSEMTYGSYISPRETAALLEAVTREDVQSLARQVLDFSRLSFSAVGNVDAPETYLALLH
ncbi:MAG: pitrilysin family protein [Clostridia bacterium]|nr:pitrilysin family protein [Clostridia bacterium]